MSAASPVPGMLARHCYSDRIVADAATVEAAITALAERLNGADVAEGSIPDRTLLCIMPDLSQAFRAQLSGGKLVGLSRANDKDAADVRLTAKSDDLVALIEGRMNVATAFLLGRVRVDAAPSDLMLLRKLF
jgi:predicted lipid carrier protein YhbT